MSTSPTAPPEVQARLLDLAALDAESTRIAAHRRRLEQDDAMTKALAERSAARREVADRRGALEDARRELGRLEGDVAVVEQRLARDRGRLAATSSPRDAQGLESEIASLLHRRSVLEDDELDVMGRVEDGESALGRAEAALAEVEARISALQLDRQDALDGLAQQAARVTEQRTALVAELPADLVALYERQRARYGIGAAPLRGAVSGGSNMALTGADLALVRAAPPDAVVLDPESGCRRARREPSAGGPGVTTAPGSRMLGGRVAGVRVVVSAIVGLVAGLASGTALRWPDGIVVGWIAAAVTFLALTWAAIGRMDGEATAAHATREDPTAGVARVGVLLASVGSLAGVALILGHPGDTGRIGSAVLGIGSVAASWFVVHSLYTLQYAALYYGDRPGGIDFNGTMRPAYADFAYVGFTVGMSFAASDTDISDPTIRHAVLRHALLSYLLGAVVLGTTINLISGIVP